MHPDDLERLILWLTLGEDEEVDETRADTQSGIVTPRVPAERRPIAQQPPRLYHNIPVVVDPRTGRLHRDRRHMDPRDLIGPGDQPRTERPGALTAFLRGVGTAGRRLVGLPPVYRGPTPGSAPRSVRVPR